MNEPDRVNPDNLNEQMLKSTAITFSLEGISRDLEVYLQKKITFNNRNFKHVSDIIRSVSSCGEEIQKSFLKKGSPISNLLDQSISEIENINAMLTFVIDNIISKESILKDDLDTVDALKEESLEEDPDKK